MKKSDLREFVDFIFSLNNTEVFISEEFEKYIVKKYQISTIEAQEYVESYINKILSEIALRIKQHYVQFTTSKYSFSSYDKDKLIKQSYVVPNEEKDNIELKLRWRDKIKQYLNLLSWRDFELLAKYILESNNIKDISITKSVKDQGIDFWGYYKVERNEFINRFKRDLEFRIVGQVKHSSKKVKVNHNKVSSFGTELNRLKTRTPPKYFTVLPNDFLNSPLPIVGLFITNTSYLPKAIDFSNDYGIIIWNGEQISEDLSNTKFLSKIMGSDNQISIEKLIELLNLK